MQMKDRGAGLSGANYCSAIWSGVTGRASDIVGVWIAPVIAHVMMTLSDRAFAMKLTPPKPARRSSPSNEALLCAAAQPETLSGRANHECPGRLSCAESRKSPPAFLPRRFGRATMLALIAVLKRRFHGRPAGRPFRRPNPVGSRRFSRETIELCAGEVQPTHSGAASRQRVKTEVEPLPVAGKSAHGARRRTAIVARRFKLGGSAHGADDSRRRSRSGDGKRRRHHRLRRAGRSDQPVLLGAQGAQQISHVLARHVEGASHMAEGYTRANPGNIGVCIGTSGPAGTDMITGLYSAAADSIPILCITGQAPRARLYKEDFQAVDIE